LKQKGESNRISITFDLTKAAKGGRKARIITGEGNGEFGWFVILKKDDKGINIV